MRTPQQNWQVIYREMAEARRRMVLEKARQEAQALAETGEGGPGAPGAGLQKERPRGSPLSFSDDSKSRWEFSQQFPRGDDRGR